MTLLCFIAHEKLGKASTGHIGARFNKWLEDQGEPPVTETTMSQRVTHCRGVARAVMDVRNELNDDRERHGSPFLAGDELRREIWKHSKVQNAAKIAGVSAEGDSVVTRILSTSWALRRMADSAAASRHESSPKSKSKSASKKVKRDVVRLSSSSSDDVSDNKDQLARDFRALQTELRSLTARFVKYKKITKELQRDVELLKADKNAHAGLDDDQSSL